MSLIKKTVVINPIIDSYIRKTWAILIEKGKDANYSSALNFMLLIAILEVLKEDSITKNIRRLVWDFMENRDTIKELQTVDMLDMLEQKLNKSY